MNVFMIYIYLQLFVTSGLTGNVHQLFLIEHRVYFYNCLCRTKIKTLLRIQILLQPVRPPANSSKFALKSLQNMSVCNFLVGS